MLYSILCRLQWVIFKFMGPVQYETDQLKRVY